jgi:hypothetical protein
MLLARRILCIAALVVASPSGRVADATAPSSPAGARPAISIVGGSPDQRHTVTAAVARYVSVGLLLPDLDVRIHTGKAGCGDKQGLFHREGEVAVIDLCFGGEFLALHELGHAWERFNLDDRDRFEFQQLTGAMTWRSTNVAWGRRGAEQAADTMAHGLLSSPLVSLEYHTVDFAWFEALTGIASPRIREVRTAEPHKPALDDVQRTRLAAYEAWRGAAAESGTATATDTSRQSPVVPSIACRDRSARPQCRAYASSSPPIGRCRWWTAIGVSLALVTPGGVGIVGSCRSESSAARR